MKNIGGTSRLIGFFDECGDHSLGKVDQDFPLFVLALVVVERKLYAEQIIHALGKFKLHYWNHEGINLHSREIRKALGPFTLLQNPQVRPSFMEELSRFMETMPYTLFITCIKKQTHVERYGMKALSPYDLALEFTMERVAHFLEGEKETDLPVVAESRGKLEDADLERVFYRILASGTYYRGADQFKKFSCPLVFRSKKDNIAGTQIADLAAYPCGRYVLGSDRKNSPYEIVRQHIYSRGGVSGWKVFP